MSNIKAWCHVIIASNVVTFVLAWYGPAIFSSYEIETVILCVVQVERTTNHDVKAIEYVLKEKFRQHEELNKV